jgi:hypothetical protein
MNLSELLQGVLSGKYAVPKGALSTPYSDAENVRDLSRQDIAMTGQQPPIMSSGPMSGVLQPSPPPGGGPPIGPGMPPQGPPQGALAPSAGPGRDPGMNGALAPPGGPGIPQSAQVGAPPSTGYGRAPDSIGNGRPPMGPGWNPQLDPNQPQASPQPGNGVLALNNATAMAQANPMGPNQPPAPPGPVDPGPTPMALQSTDESTPTPQAKPGALAGDPHTRAKGILAAAVSGDPQAMQQAVMDPRAASQAGSQVPDGPNWNPGSAYDTTDAPPPPKNAADAQKQADAAHDQDKQQTFGQKALGVLSNPDTGLLLQSIGVGLMTSRNPWQGIGQGVQMYQQLHLKNQDRQLEAKRLDVQERRADIADKRAQTQLDQGQQRLGLEKGDQELRRGQYAAEAKRYDAKFAYEQTHDKTQDALKFGQLAEERRFHDGELSNSRMSAQAALLNAQQGGKNPYDDLGTFYDADNNALFGSRNKQTDQIEFKDASGNVVQNPQGLIRAVDGQLRSFNSTAGKLSGEVVKEGEQAHESVKPLKLARDMINASPDLYMGKGADSVQAWRQLMVSAGWADADTVNKAATVEELSSLAGRQVTAFAAQTKGSTSNYEDKNYINWAFGPGKTRLGNLGLIDISVRAMERQDEKGQFYAENADKLGYARTAKMWREYEDKNPVYKDMPGFGATPSANGGNSVSVGGKTISYTVEK